MDEEVEVQSETVAVELPRKMLKRFMDARNAWQAEGTPEGTPQDAEFSDAMQDFIATTATAMLFDGIDVKAMEGEVAGMKAALDELRVELVAGQSERLVLQKRIDECEEVLTKNRSMLDAIGDEGSVEMKERIVNMVLDVRGYVENSTEKRIVHLCENLLERWADKHYLADIPVPDPNKVELEFNRLLTEQHEIVRQLDMDKNTLTYERELLKIQLVEAEKALAAAMESVAAGNALRIEHERVCKERDLLRTERDFESRSWKYAIANIAGDHLCNEEEAWSRWGEPMTFSTEEVAQAYIDDVLGYEGLYVDEVAGRGMAYDRLQGKLREVQAECDMLNTDRDRLMDAYRTLHEQARESREACEKMESRAKMAEAALRPVKREDLDG